MLNETFYLRKFKSDVMLVKAFQKSNKKKINLEKINHFYL